MKKTCRGCGIEKKERETVGWRGGYCSQSCMKAKRQNLWNEFTEVTRLLSKRV